MKNITVCSGGQTGVDRAALDAARDLGFKITGYVPKGYLCEDHFDLHGVYPELVETNSSSYPQRTVLNVKNSDATLILSFGKNDGRGTLLTMKFLKQYKKPFLIVDLLKDIPLTELLNKPSFKNVNVLNIAGARESSSKGIYKHSKAFLLEYLPLLNKTRTVEKNIGFNM